MILQEIKGRFTITLPKDAVRLAGWVKGQELAVVSSGKGELTVKELKS